jgi:hypothetical protein
MGEKHRMNRLLYFLFFSFLMSGPVRAWAQVLSSGTPFYEEQLRRLDLTGSLDKELSFLIRPIDFRKIAVSQKDSLRGEFYFRSSTEKKKQFTVLPVQFSYRYNPDNLNAYGDRLMVPTAGHQTYVTAGFYSRFGIVNLQFQPEFVFAENRVYDGFPEYFNPSVTYTRFIYWNYGDYPERFGEKSYKKFWWGQSKIALTGKHVELYAGTQNIAWGPGQFNSLIFSNNAPGFPHLSINTVNPLKTFLGSFEAQIIAGRLMNSFEPPSQHPDQNQQYFIPFESDWRYLNGFTLSYQPKWLEGFYFGLNRTFQVNNNLMGDTFMDYFPIFEIFQKEDFFKDGNSSEYDAKGTDQQVSIFSRIVSRKAKAELYFEFGRRDHAYNWRDFILSPDHARAYLLGFQKLISLDSRYRFLQFRGEIVHQQESVNRYMRYLGTGGNLTWHTHGTARGFTNFGQALGVGTGVGSNSQILEVSIVDDKSKTGLLLSRLENNQDFFYRAFGQIENGRPWIDFGLGLIYDRKWSALTLSSKLDLVMSNNFQWESYLKPNSNMKTSSHSFRGMLQVNLIYTISKPK